MKTKELVFLLSLFCLQNIFAESTQYRVVDNMSFHDCEYQFLASGALEDLAERMPLYFNSKSFSYSLSRSLAFKDGENPSVKTAAQDYEKTQNIPLGSIIEKQKRAVSAPDFVAFDYSLLRDDTNLSLEVRLTIRPKDLKLSPEQLEDLPADGEQRYQNFQKYSPPLEKTLLIPLQFGIGSNFKSFSEGKATSLLISEGSFFELLELEDLAEQYFLWTSKMLYSFFSKAPAKDKTVGPFKVRQESIRAIKSTVALLSGSINAGFKLSPLNDYSYETIVVRNLRVTRAEKP